MLICFVGQCIFKQDGRLIAVSVAHAHVEIPIYRRKYTTAKEWVWIFI